MNSVSKLPSTLGGLKGYAKSLRRNDPTLTHSKALDLASAHMGLDNYRHAQRVLGQNVAASLLHPVFLTAYWRERTGMPRAAGRETLRVELGKPLSSLVRPHQIHAGRNLEHFRMEFEDHLERRQDLESQAAAHQRLINAANTLRFMEATGLVPATTQGARRAISVDDLPGRDHVSRWVEPQTGDVLVLDEPYRPSVAGVAGERKVWLARHGLYEFAPSWAGLYYPGHATPFLVVRNRAFGDRVMRSLDAIAKLPAITWMGESGAYPSRFRSPQREQVGKDASPRIMPAYPGTVRAGAIAYGGRPGEKGEWRPAKPMPVELHERASDLLQSLSFTGVSATVEREVSMVRSRLEDWALAEHREAFASRSDLYYGGAPRDLRENVPTAVNELIGILKAGYEACAPRRELLDRLYRAEALMKGKSEAGS